MVLKSWNRIAVWMAIGLFLMFFRTLRILSSLDVSNNNINYVPNNAFVTLRFKYMYFLQVGNSLRREKLLRENLCTKAIHTLEVFFSGWTLTREGDWAFQFYCLSPL